jgi:hypothetical protein
LARCNTCGSEVGPSVNYCDKCGTRLRPLNPLAQSNPRNIPVIFPLVILFAGFVLLATLGGLAPWALILVGATVLTVAVADEVQSESE